MRRRRQAAPRPQPKPYKILAQDDGDDDGGTIYYLLDDMNRVVSSSAWPQPLEHLAHIVGHPTLRVSYGGGVDDGDDR